MPKYTNVPPKDPRGHALPIMRTPAGKKFRCTITSPDIVGCNTHYWGGKTVPCEAPECEACRNGIPYRWHAYCSAVLHPNMLHIIYEVTALAAEALVLYRKSHTTLRGCLVEAYRWRGAANGRIILKCEPSAQPPDSLPTPPDLTRCLAIIWQLPEDAVSTDETDAFVTRVAASTTIPGTKFPEAKGPDREQTA